MTIKLKAHASVIFTETPAVKPSKPTLISATAGDTEAVLLINAAADADVVYARYRTFSGGAWSTWNAENETDKRTGDGTITITGLTNDTKYQFGIYAKESVDNLTSDWDFGYATPTAGATAPTGMYTLPLHYLKLTLAGSPNFQDWVGAADEIEALDYIHKVEKAGDLTPPFAVVDWGENINRMQSAGGAHNYFVEHGDLYMLFRGAIDATHAADTAADVFLNVISSIVDDMEGLAGRAGYLNISGTTMQKAQRPGEDELKSSEDSDGNQLADFYEVVIQVEF